MTDALEEEFVVEAKTGGEKGAELYNVVINLNHVKLTILHYLK